MDSPREISTVTAASIWCHQWGRNTAVRADSAPVMVHRRTAGEEEMMLGRFDARVGGWRC
jgi:hypothetical protein